MNISESGKPLLSEDAAVRSLLSPCCFSVEVIERHPRAELQ